MILKMSVELYEWSDFIQIIDFRSSLIDIVMRLHRMYTVGPRLSGTIGTKGLPDTEFSG